MSINSHKKTKEIIDNLEILQNSKCCTNSKQKVFCKKIIQEKIKRKFRTINLYRASEHGWTADDFYRMSEYKDATITLMLSDSG